MRTKVIIGGREKLPDQRPYELKQSGEYQRALPLSLTLAVPAIPAKIAAAGVLKLAVAFGADADHVGHDGAGDGFLGVVLGLLFARDGAGGIRKILYAAHGDHDALGNCLLR